MTNYAMPAPNGRDPLPAVAVPAGVPAGVVYDTLGMPMSVQAARAMTAGSVQAGLGRALAKLHHEPVSSVSAKAPIDSIEVVYLIGRFYRELGRKQPDLSKIDRDRWSNLEGVADVVHRTIGDLK